MPGVRVPRQPLQRLLVESAGFIEPRLPVQRQCLLKGRFCLFCGLNDHGGGV
jgi:hypothetical protein